ncbi:hypothetical protein TRAPUB_9370, partial [Trametes pubescens]
NPLCRAARRADGCDVVVRVLAIGERGRDHVEILKTVSIGPYAFYEDNHNIPLLDLVYFDNITFGVFPRVGCRMQEAYGFWAKNSVGDVVDMILQCLEALAFIHSLSIAHRDAFKDNFLVEWHPESLETGHVARSRPRVYLTDFETAVMFSDETPLEECLVSGYPEGDSYPDDVENLENFKSTISEIDGVLDGLRWDDAKARLSSFDALEYLSRAVAEVPPKALLIPPETDAPPPDS